MKKFIRYNKVIAIATALILMTCSTDVMAGIGTTGTNTTEGVKRKSAGKLDSGVPKAEKGMGIDPNSRVVSTIPENSALSHECVSDYDVRMPSFNKLDANSVVDSISTSPTRLDDKWYVADHIGVRDSAFGGARHVVKRDTGIQWFGYDADPNNDIMLREHSAAIYSINVKQAPVRADWHTINGSGIVFGASFTEPTGSHELGSKSATSFSGYAFVATQENIEVRFYPTTTLSAFSDGSAAFEVLYTTPKKCNSQSLTIDFDGDKPIFKIGVKELGANIDYKPKGNYIGAMVDYAEHNCSSLSTVYMFNYTVNGENFF